MTKDHKIIQATCPTRIDFTGGFTDVLPFRATQWVSHVNLAIDLSITVLLEPRNDGLISIEDHRGNTLVQAHYSSDIEDRYSLVKTALRKFGVENNLGLVINSKAPSGAGLGTSGALSVALTAAFMLLRGETLPKNLLSLAVLAADVERESGVVGGLQDQFAATMGGLNVFRFYRDEYASRRINLTDTYMGELEQRLLIVYPGGDRRSTDTVTGVMDEYRSGNPTVTNALLSLDSAATEIVDALECGDWKKLATLFSTVLEQQLKLHPGLVDSGNQKIIHELRDENVNGVKLLGGGGVGACLLVFCPDNESRKVVEVVSEMNSVKIFPVRRAKNGLRVAVQHQGYEIK